MTNVDLLLATLHLQRADRDPRRQGRLLDDLRRRLNLPSAVQCCQPPRGYCCWEAL